MSRRRRSLAAASVNMLISFDQFAAAMPMITPVVTAISR